MGIRSWILNIAISKFCARNSQVARNAKGERKKSMRKSFDSAELFFSFLCGLSILSVNFNLTQQQVDCSKQTATSEWNDFSNDVCSLVCGGKIFASMQIKLTR
jgi:hypothetical protein